MRRFPAPILEDVLPAKRAGLYLERAAFADALRAATKQRHLDIVRRLWPDDRVTPLLLMRGAVDPATTTIPAWAGVTATSAVGDFVANLAPISAGAKLLNAALRVTLDGANTITFPRRNAAISAADVAWVAEGNPIPVLQMTFGGASLGPTKKLAVVVVVTRELMEHSTAEQVLRQLLRENAAFSLDASLFSDAAATTARPAGILNGVPALTATAGGGDTALLADLEQLSAGIADSSSNLVFITHPRQANAIRLRHGAIFPDIDIWASTAVAAGTVIALDPAAFVSGFGPEPEIESSTETVVHMESETPSQIGVVGTPNVVAAPGVSAWQSDVVAMRLVLRAAWTWRTPNTVAWLQSATWG